MKRLISVRGLMVAVAVIGIALAYTGQTPQAIEHARRALEINPNSVNAHRNLGFLLAGTGNAAEAIAQYEAALRLAPNNAEIYNSFGDVLRQCLGAKGALTEDNFAYGVIDDLFEAAHMRALLVRTEVHEAIQASGKQLFGAHWTRYCILRRVPARCFGRRLGGMLARHHARGLSGR